MQNLGTIGQKKQRFIQRFMVILAICFGAIFTLLLIIRISIWLSFRSRIFPVSQSPSARIAIVFGAGLTHNGNPTPILMDRVKAAAQLYFSGKVEKLLLSGDNSFVNYNEPGAMQKYAIELGVPKDALVLDYAGRRTYDTCYRAKYIFKVDEAVLVTQNFHLPRALLTCNAFGIQSTGVSADLRKYQTLSLVSWQVRETLASFVAVLDVYIIHPKPVMGPNEPIFP